MLSGTGLSPSQLQNWEASQDSQITIDDFIKGYAKVTCPLYDQISGDNAAH